MEGNVVLVTGGSGFLGQHVVKHIDMYDKDVTEIRVLDCKPYQQNLDFDARVRVRAYVGSITDTNILKKAVKGVNCVFHVASLIDFSLIPERNALREVNVQGTVNVVNACKEENVEFLIYCGSISSFQNFDENIENGSEDTLYPQKNSFEYAETKRQAMDIVLKENGFVLDSGKTLRTIALLPPGMYGEEDKLNFAFKCQLKEGTHFRLLGETTAILQLSYVGNVAMMFVNAYQTMRKNKDLGGEYFFVADDTPKQNAVESRHIYIPNDNAKIKSSLFYVPKCVVLFVLFITYYVLLILRLFYDVRFPLSPSVIKIINRSFFVSYGKANKILGYKPMYSYQTSLQNTKGYFRKMKEICG